MRPCTRGPRHEWAWLKNVMDLYVGPRYAGLTLRGLYRCECGARKLGQPNHNTPQEGAGLLSLVESLAKERT